MEKKTLLSTLWVVLTVNFIFCDVFTLMHSEDLKKILTGVVDNIEISQEFLLFFAFMMEIPMLMILFSRLLKYKINKILNIISALLLTVIQVWSLTSGSFTLHYAFFSLVEISICIFIFLIAVFWKPSHNT
ncbi:MAG: DUF6326 family protein [Cytophagales bacterium]